MKTSIIVLLWFTLLSFNGTSNAYQPTIVEKSANSTELKEIYSKDYIESKIVPKLNQTEKSRTNRINKESKSVSQWNMTVKMYRNKLWQEMMQVNQWTTKWKRTTTNVRIPSSPNNTSPESRSSFVWFLNLSPSNRYVSFYLRWYEWEKTILMDVRSWKILIETDWLHATLWSNDRQQVFMLPARSPGMWTSSTTYFTKKWSFPQFNKKLDEMGGSYVKSAFDNWKYLFLKFVDSPWPTGTPSPSVLVVDKQNLTTLQFKQL